MLTAALFTTAKTWEQSKCPFMVKWIKKIYTHVHTNTKILFRHKKELNLAICDNMDEL